MRISKKTIGLIAGPLVFCLIQYFFHPSGLNSAAHSVLASTAWIAIWWITEALPIAATALMPIILFPLTGATKINEAVSGYSHPYIFLFIGGFMLAIALEKWQLHKRIALSIIKIVGTNQPKVILGFMIATAFLSMWISNTATTVMMLPIGMAIVMQLTRDENETSTSHFGKALMLGIAYSASIGGIATLIGTPPNLILAGVLQRTYGVEISFVQWIRIGLPFAVIMLVICWVYLTKFAFKLDKHRSDIGKSEISAQLKKLGRLGFEEKLVLAVFVLTAFAWISRSYILQNLIPGIDDTIIAISAGVLLFILPSSTRGEHLITWEDAVKLPWGVLLLFGGGISLAVGFDSSGLAEWIGLQLNSIQGISIFLLLLILIAAVNFLTEITSNLATTAVILPILAPLALVVDVHPFVLMVGTAMAASCAFMLPVATPPNALVFGSGYFRITDMMKAGVWLNLISIIILLFLVYYVLPFAWSLDITPFPEGLNNLID